MVKWDVLRIFKNKKILLYIAGILLLNLYIIMSTNYDFKELAEYKHYFGLVSKLNYEELIRNEDAFLSDDEAMEMAQTAYLEVKENLEYDSYLQGVVDHADAMLAFPKYNLGFSKKNIEKTKRDFQKLQGKTVVMEPSVGILALSKTDFADYSILVLILYLTMIIVLKDRETNMLSIVRSTFHGRGKIVISRLCTVLVTVSIVSVSLFLENYISIAARMPLGDLHRCIQSVYGFKDCMLSINVYQYILCYYLAKWLAYLAAACLIYAFAVLSADSAMLFVMTICFFGAEKIFYLHIPDASMFVCVKYMNIWSLLDSENILTKYININVFGHPIGLLCLSVFVGLVVIVLSVIISRFAYQKCLEFKMYQRFRNAVSLIRDWLTDHAGLSNMQLRSPLVIIECRKMLVSLKVGLIFILFLLVVQVAYRPENRYYVSGDEAWYRSYMMQLEGEITPDKEQYIVEEEKRFQSVIEDIAASDNLVEQVLLQQKLGPYEGFQRVLTQYQELLAAGKKYFIYETGYQYLTFGNGMGEDLCLAGILIIFIIASFARIFEIEKACKTDMIVRTTCCGKKRLGRMKYVLAIGLFTLMWLIVYVGRVGAIAHRYGLGSFMSDADSITNLSGAPSGISILCIVILLHVFVYVLELAMVLITLKLSEKMNGLGEIMIAGLIVGAVLLGILYGFGSLFIVCMG